jgi:DNA polymerase-4
VFAVLEEFTPHIEPLSVDEAFLDVGGLRRHHPSPEAVGEEIRRRIRSRLGLPASVGVSAVKFVAKMASDDAKPDGLLKVAAGDEAAYLAPLSVRRLWGVGEATHASLETLGVRTIGELAEVAPRLLEATVGRTVASRLAALANGVDPRAVERVAPVRSISVEETYDEDLHPSQAPAALAVLCDRLARRLLHADTQQEAGSAGPGTGVRAGTVILKVRFEDFTTVTRQLTTEEPVAGSRIWPVVGRLWSEVPATGRGIRLLGVGAAALAEVDAPRQMRLAGAGTDRTGDLVDEIRARFGDDAVVPGELIRPRRGDLGGSG